MLLLENTPILSSSEIMRIYNNTPAESGLFSPQLRDRPKYLPEWVIAELADRSSVAVVEYINNLREAASHCRHTTHASLKTRDNPQAHNMSAVTCNTASERLGVDLSDPYRHRMQRNRPQWYKGSPLDTAPKIFAPWRRNHVPLIRDWQTCHRVVSKKAAWMGKAFSDKYYEINGVIWAWDDPASKFLVELFTGAMNTVEFAISADAFWAPHIVVTHSPGDEPEYLDSHGNPDQLTNRPREDDPRRIAPIPEGYTPRQNTIGPTGMEQLFLPPRQHMVIEREDWSAQCAEVTMNRYRAIQKLSIRFHLGLERIRAGQQLLDAVDATERGRDTSVKDITGSHDEASDFVPMTQDEVTTSGWDDADATSSLLRRGIMFQMCMNDLAEMADAAILSDDEDAGDEETSEPSLPSGPSISGDTYDVLRKLGMVYEGEDEAESDEDEDGAQPSSSSLPHSQTIAPDTYTTLRKLGMVFDDDAEESDDQDIEEDSETDDSDDSESEDEEQSITGQSSLRIPDFNPTIPESASTSSQLDSTGLQASTGSLDLASILTEERSSVSSFSEDQESDESGCETPDTEDYYDC